MSRARVGAWIGLTLLLASVSVAAVCGPPSCAQVPGPDCHPSSTSLRPADCCSSHRAAAVPDPLLTGIASPRVATLVAAAVLAPSTNAGLAATEAFDGRPSTVSLFTLHRSLLL